MQKIKTIIAISEVIAREVCGNHSVADKELLNHWLNSSEKNRAIYHRILDSRKFEERNRLYVSINVKQAWNDIEKVLLAERRKKYINLMLRYAAAVFIPVLLALGSYFYFNNPSPEISKPIAEIQPGTRNATLVFASGESVDLLNDSTKNFVENDGTLIKHDGEELRYKEEQSGKKSKKALLNTLIVPRGGEYSVVLSDGTRVMVNSMSKLVFPVNFLGDKREVVLEEGEAYFQVAFDESRPFIVTVKGVEVEVLGTSFNIKAYTDDNYSYTTLVEGRVKLNSTGLPSDVQILEPDQQAVFNPVSYDFTIHQVDAKQIVRWTTGKYLFTDQTLEEIMKTLSRWYDFEYNFEDESIKAMRFEGGLNKYESIAPILDIITKTNKVKVVVDGKEVSFLKI